VLHTCQDWVLLVDIGRQLKFPNFIVSTALRPDMVLYSVTKKTVVLVELTCPSEENLEIRHAEKLAKYEELVKECKTNGWGADLFAVEVGARGYVAETTRFCLAKLGLNNTKVRNVCKQVSDTALRWSFWIWIGKDKDQWFAGKNKEVQTPDAVEAENCIVDENEETVEVENCIVDENEETVEVENCSVDEGEEAVDSTDVEWQLGILRQEVAERSVVGGRRTTCGLKNLGNSCYINAVLQCLSVVDGGPTGPQGEDRNKFVAEYENLVEKLRGGRERIVTPSRFKRSLAKTDGTYNNTNPQDAQEFLSCLLAVLKEERGSSNGVEVRGVGQMRLTMACTVCTYSSGGEEDFNMLSLPVGNQPNQLLNDCLEDHMEDESIMAEVGWRCEGCGTVREGRKKLNVVKPPELLIIHMKRFKCVDGQIEKIDAEVGIGKLLHGVQYHLSGVVKHRGSRESGHYVAEIRTGGSWLQVNDEKTNPTAVSELHWCSEAYLLFYETSPVSDTSIRRGPATSESRN
jgi:ubiquitin C-terminal hydrolase